MVLYLEDIKKLGKNQVKQMAHEMAMQPQLANATNCKGQGAYCHPFFQGNIIDLYHKARDLYYLKKIGLDDYGNSEYAWFSTTKTKSDIEPFFTKGSPQNEWRLLYNKTCDLFDKTLRNALKKKDKRFINWSIKDTKKNIAFLSTDTKPT